ncbi:hypothetical protein OG21DRAFT_1215750 [Imleria badia]|nr:hypothetical protein OG21DRAFT_1215750 [Imleria badia]
MLSPSHITIENRSQVTALSHLRRPLARLLQTLHCLLQSQEGYHPLLKPGKTHHFLVFLIPFLIYNVPWSCVLHRRASEGGAGSGITVQDMEQGRTLFAAGIKDTKLPDNALEEAMLMKQAGRETRRLRALASAWELKEVEHFQKLLGHIHHWNEDNLRKFDALRICLNQPPPTFS